MSAQEFAFKPSDRLLMENVLNEVLNGFRVDNFSSVIGMDESELNNVLSGLHDLPNDAQLRLSLPQTLAFRNALREALRELGTEEFHSRTGFDFESAKTFLDELNTLIQPSKSIRDG